ncbi:hypothetical protein C8J57DRAFT_625855 [Mycena rebaudengoi]|nr:hypothetical protein C8J57DRAFT_625855 [Mycena rebaudengoi]
MPVERTRGSRRAESDGSALVWTHPVAPPPSDGSPIAFATNVTPTSFSPTSTDSPTYPWSAFAQRPSSPDPIVGFAHHDHTSFVAPPAARRTVQRKRNRAKDSAPTTPPTPTDGNTPATPHIPRPPNAFILFRSSFIRAALIPARVEPSHSTLSRIIGLTWQALPEAERSVWHAKARKAREEHAKRFPGYAFRPRRGNVDKGQGDGEGDEDDPGDTGDTPDAPCTPPRRRRTTPSTPRKSSTTTATAPRKQKITRTPLSPPFPRAQRAHRVAPPRGSRGRRSQHRYSGVRRALCGERVQRGRGGKVGGRECVDAGGEGGGWGECSEPEGGGCEEEEEDLCVCAVPRTSTRTNTSSVRAPRSEHGHGHDERVRLGRRVRLLPRYVLALLPLRLRTRLPLPRLLPRRLPQLRLLPALPLPRALPRIHIGVHHRRVLPRLPRALLLQRHVVR